MLYTHKQQTPVLQYPYKAGVNAQIHYTTHGLMLGVWEMVYEEKEQVEGIRNRRNMRMRTGGNRRGKEREKGREHEVGKYR